MPKNSGTPFKVFGHRDQFLSRQGFSYSNDLRGIIARIIVVHILILFLATILKRKEGHWLST